MRQYRIEVAPGAVNDLISIRDYIENELGSPIAAERTLNAILDAIKQLESLPLRNKALTMFPDGRELRRAKAGNYLALYVVADRIVSVLAVVYGKSNLENRIANLFGSEN